MAQAKIVHRDCCQRDEHATAASILLSGCHFPVALEWKVTCLRWSTRRPWAKMAACLKDLIAL